VHWRAWIAVASAVACATPSLCAQTSAPAATTRPAPAGFHVTGASASTWQEGDASVMLIAGPVVIRTDESVLRADNAVVWLQPVFGSPEAQRVAVALIGNAQIETGGATRSGDRQYVTAVVRGDVRFEAARRVARDDRDTPLYRAAAELREAEEDRAQALAPAPDPTTRTTQPTPATAPQPDPLADVPAGTGARISSPNPHLVISDDEVTYVLPNVSIFHRWPDGAYVEMYAENAVAFTGLKASDPKNRTPGAAEASLKAVYLEGDVRIIYMPVGVDRLGEQRLTAKNAFFRIADRSAVLTQAVLHTEDLKANMPFVMRARTLKKLSDGGDGAFEARGVQLTTSQFARPSFAIEASRIYVHQPQGESPRFRASNTLFKFVGVPLFWLPYAAGTATGRGAPIRDIAFERRGDVGIGVRTTWGLFETVGLEPPRALDAEYRVDYYTDRGPAGGLNAEYLGGLVTENTKQSSDFLGEVDSYFVYEHGQDNLGSGRSAVVPEYKELRGVAGFRHQHFFPDGWQLQAQSWYVTDPTFLEEWKPYDRQFDEEGPRETALYLKRQVDNHAFTFLLSGQPNDFVTASDLQQEQFEVERLPEIGYHRVGDGLGTFATFYSNNLVSGLQHNVSDASLAEQGFTGAPNSTPGIPSLGTTGIADDLVWRGDFRQEVQFPFNLGPVRAIPYVVGRYTPYSEGVGGSAVSRVLGGAGTRFTTSFVRVCDRAHSELFDIHRMRHVVQPEVHLFAGVQNVERNEVFIFDEPVDDISDLSALNVALRQRWQTKRGGPGRWRSSDVFTLNLEGSFFRNRPAQAPGFAGLPAAQTPPDDFRGVFYSSIPEASIPRNTLSVDGTWRLSDSTVVIGDAQYNLDENVLATAAIGLNVAREDRVRYYAGLRYIEPFNSNILTLAMDYQITPKYLVSVFQGYDFGEGENVTTGLTLTRRFDKFWMQMSTSVDRRTEERTISFNFIPEGLPVSSATVQSWVPQQQE
jgi:hypothetical protein